MENLATNLSNESLLVMRDAAVGQMEFARNYTLGLLESVPEELWPVIPGGAKSHIAWQVAHLAVAEYGLMLFRQRGRAEGDLELMPGWLRKNYGRGSSPAIDPQSIPSKRELMDLLNRIHQTALDTASSLPAETLAEPTEMPYAVYPIKLGALLFCPMHESIHAGQIGVLRRLHGLDPVR